MDRRLIECLNQLQSHLVTARKKSVIELQDILQHDEIIKLINETSENDPESMLSWSSIFIAAHNALLKEIDKLMLDSGKLKSRVNSDLVKNVQSAALVSVIVTKANSDVCYLDCSTIIDASIHILRKKSHKIFVGHIYENMLRQHILCVEKFWYQIKKETWEDLFELVKHLLDDPPPRTSMSAIVQMMNLIVFRGCEQASFIDVLKKEKIFVILEKIVRKAVEDKKVDFQFSALSLAVTVCQKLQKECRVAICKFGEENLQTILNMYETKGESFHKKTQKMLDFILILMEAHHPDGVDEDSDKAYALNWEDWKKALKQLNFVTIREIAVLQRQGTMSENFLKFVVEVYNQVFRMNISSVNITIDYSLNETSGSSDVSASKKRRINCGFVDIIDRLGLSAKPVDMWPWLAVLSSLMAKYPSLVSSSDYSLILQNMSTLLSASKEPTVTDHLCRCCVALIGVRQKLKNEDLKSDEDAWNSVWNLVLRTIGLNQNVKCSHELLRCMMNNMWKPTMGIAILKLYLSHVVQFSKDSLLTLYALRERTAFPNSILDVVVHSSLLRWLIPSADVTIASRDLSELPLDIYAHVTLLCCSKNNIKKTQIRTPLLDIDNDMHSDDSLPVSVVYSLNSYDSDGLLQFSKSQKIDIIENEVQIFSLNVEAIEQLSNFIEENCESLFEHCHSTTDRIFLLRQLGSYFIFLVHLLNFKNHYSVEWDAIKINNLLQSLLSKLILLLEEILTPELNEKKLMKCLNFLADFFKQLGSVPANTVPNTWETIFPQLQYICTVFEFGAVKKNQDEMECETLSFGEEGYQSLFNSKILSISDQIRFEACKVLVHYSYHYDFICQTQQNILNAVLDVLETVEEKQRSKCFLQMAVYTCFAALKISKLDSSTFDGITRVIQSLCETKNWSQTGESALMILKLIRRGFQVVEVDHSDGWNNLKILLNGMSKILAECGIRTTVEVIQCLGLFTNTEIGHHCLCTEQPVSLICEEIVPYLKHPSHEIRITAARFLCKIFCVFDHFASHEDMKLDCDKFTMKFIETLGDCFAVDDSLLDDMDEIMNRPISVLYALISAICSSMVGRRKFIYRLFDIIHEKRVKQDFGRKVLNIAKNHLKLNSILPLVKDNFLFVCWCWFKKYNTFENFPYEVLSCKSLKEFYNLFLKDIVVVLLFYGKLEMIDSIGTTIESSTYEIFSNCFAEIMSLLLIRLAANNDAPEEGITANDLQNILLNAIEINTIEEQILPRLPDVLVSVLRSLHDLQLEVPNGSILPGPTAFTADKNLIEETIMLLKSTAGAESSSLVIHLAEHFPGFIQKILQQLYIDVINSSTLEVKLAAFQRYILFCQLLFPHYQDLLRYQMVVFITRTILCNVLNFISSDICYKSLSLTALRFLQIFIQQWVSDDYKYEKSTLVFKNHLGKIVDKLVPLASQKNNLGKTTLGVLHCFLIDRSECLFESISKLDLLPDLPEFEPFRNSYLQEQETQMQDLSLANDVEQFLSAAKFSPHSPCRAESLKYLRKQLLLLKPELFKMFESIGNKQLFSEDCRTSIPHRFILALLRSIDLRDQKVRFSIKLDFLSNPSSYETIFNLILVVLLGKSSQPVLLREGFFHRAPREVSYEAVCCLGEIGLVDLQTIVLQPSHDVASSISEAEILIVETLCLQLIECIVDDNVDVVNASCHVLKLILLCESGYNLVRGDHCSFDKLLIHPFIPSSSDEIVSDLLLQYFDFRKFKDGVDNESLWVPVQNISHEIWVTNLVCAILDSFVKNCFLNAMQSVCRLKAVVSESVLKYLVYLLVSDDFGEPKKILQTRINQFFESTFVSNKSEVYDSYSSNHSSTGKVTAIFCNKSSVRCLLDVVHFVRLRQREPNSNSLEINYLYAGKAAQYCSAFFTSLLYGELWMNSLIQNSDVEYDGNVSSFLEMISEKSSSIDPNELLNILRRAFSKIGDSDALFGCRSSILIHPETRIEHYRQVEDWKRVVESCDVQLCMNSNSFANINDLASAIGFCGFSYIQNHYLSSLNQNQQSPLPNDGLYESGWKLAKWDLEEPMDDCKSFSYYQYAALKDFHQCNFNGARINIMNARQCIVPSLAKVFFESTKNMYNVMSKLQCLQEIEDMISGNCLETILENWMDHDNLATNLSFSHKQVILNQRVRLIDSTLAEGKEFVMSIAKKARKEGFFTFADTCLAIVRKNEADLPALFELKIRFEEAQLLWDRKEQDLARYLLKNLQKQASAVNPVFYSSVLRTYGKWLSEINVESADTILNNYFLPAAKIMSDDLVDREIEQKNRLKTFKCVAEFADLQYRALYEYTKSDEFEEQIKSVTESKRQSEALGDQNMKTKVSLANQSRIEDSQVKGIQNRKRSYLVLAMRYYLKILAEGAEDDLKVFRVVSFWLDNKTNMELHKEIRDILFQIPSYKFVPVLPQLVAHISSSVDVFGHSLSKLIERCIVDHPHHTLPLILSLANYAKDQQYEKNKKSTRKVTKEERVVTATAFVNKFRYHERVGKILVEMEKLSDAYIQFAYFKNAKSVTAGEVIPIPSQCSILKIFNFESIICPTVTLPVCKNAVYSDIIGVRRIDPNFTTACGINAPKRIACLCTDGKTRYQLIKGQDDMRVDAVMQQVFTIMNKLLSENKQTSKRKLLIRTYKVVPLSQRSGVLEWCTNTISLGEYLCFRNTSVGAHHRFRPNDIRTDKARKRIEAARICSDDEKIKAFQKVCKEMKPVFRYFFVEKFPLPTMWFERKLAYTHSVAVTSMVGYILGIGDRHVQNMLIDEKTAEIIHIDFGIAFDQGQNLNCPELIPFRLTRDIEDGMGIFSIDGIFRRCCEQTLLVLRENSDIIRTAGEVFIHDPLYQWILTPEKKASLQDLSNNCPNQANQVTEVSITAPRALSRIKLKLQGLEEGTATTVEGQVNRLIQQAKDVRNLSKLFCGWQAYL